MPGQVVSPKTSFSSLLVVGVLVALASVAAADEVDPGNVDVPTPEGDAPSDTLGWTASMTPFQASLFTPAQIFTPATPVRGMRLNVIYGEQTSIWGLDVGTLNRTTSDVRGVQIGAVNWGREFTGVQIGSYNINDSDDPSLQTGVRVNLTFGVQAKFRGFDFGAFNMTTLDMRGLQIAIVNANLGSALGMQLGVGNSVQGGFTGFQLGLVNVIEGKGDSVQMGIVNSSGEGARLQLGLSNFATSLKGVQIGLFNINAARTPLFFLPVINVGW
jgi:hypothetical protein